ncbi:MAG: iron export ABC transporter permease subunit FetB [Acidobacteriota bacterium]
MSVVQASYVEISLGQLGAAAALLAVNIVLSLALRLGLARDLLVASVRMVVQLLLVGLVLEWVFGSDEPLVILTIALLMAGIASVSAVRRTSRRFAGIYWSSLVSILGASFLVTGFALTVVLQTDPWWEPQYLIPLHGMLLGNALSGISLGLERFLEGCARRRGELEGLLALGATRWEAARGEVRGALRVGLVPTINSMMVMGIVSLPGMMTGQILAGAAPADAVRYQIVILFMIASCVALATTAVVALAFRRLFDRSHRLRRERLREA